MVSKKIILTGNSGVGKTSLFNRFLYSKFDEKYLTTIGVKVDRKVVHINDQVLTLLLWDIAGEVSQDKVPVSYFMGASGIIYVFDLSRPVTIVNLEKDIAYLKQLLPGVVISIVGNKTDLVDEERITEILGQLNTTCDTLTSAKTGEHVEELFLKMGAALLAKV